MNRSEPLTVEAAGPLTFVLRDHRGNLLHVEHGPEAQEVCQIVARLACPDCFEHPERAQEAA